MARVRHKRHGPPLRLASASASVSGRKSCAQESIVTGKVLFVDDEPLVLDALRRMLHDKFHIYTADSGEKGLAAVEQNGPFAVVISDMRMPGMNGAEFLARIRKDAPDTVRMLLTGFTDLDAAIAAVNEGNIFRFLTKPCRKDELVGAINLGLAQYRSTLAGKEQVKNAHTIEHPAAEWEPSENCEWDNCQGPTGLPGPSQARELLTPLFGADHQTYVILFKLTVLETIEERYGEEAGADYLINVAQYLTQSLRSEDRLFHWGRNSSDGCSPALDLSRRGAHGGSSFDFGPRRPGPGCPRQEHHGGHIHQLRFQARFPVLRARRDAGSIRSAIHREKRGRSRPRTLNGLSGSPAADRNLVTNLPVGELS